MRATEKKHPPTVSLRRAHKVEAKPLTELQQEQAGETGKTGAVNAPEVSTAQRELLEASKPGGGGVPAGKGVLGFRLTGKPTLEDVRAQIAELKATSKDPMTSSHMAEINPAELTHLDLQAYQAIVVEKSTEWREKTPAFDSYFADVKQYVDDRRAAEPRFDALKDTRENFGAFLRHVVIIHAVEERMAAKAAARAAQGG